MKKRLLIFGLILHLKTTVAQIDSSKYLCILTVHQSPEFIGGQKVMYEFLSANLQWPDSTRCVEGTVYVGFTVEIDGSLTGIHVKKGFHKDFEEEALRVVQLMPKWQPARYTQTHELLSCKFTLPIRFRLE